MCICILGASREQVSQLVLCWRSARQGKTSDGLFDTSDVPIIIYTVSVRYWKLMRAVAGFDAR